MTELEFLWLFSGEEVLIGKSQKLFPLMDC